MGARETDLISLFQQMVRIRRFEEEAARAYAQGKIGGFLHLYIGQEAVAVGILAGLTADDYVITTYRDHGFALARGMSARAAMAELFGRDDGCSRGMGGSMHMFDREHNFLGGHGIVGGHVALATGFAFKAKYAREDRVTVCLFGEGATNIGGFHEGLSLAGLWKLPIIFVCENNEYSMGTPLSRTLPELDLTKKTPGYRMPGVRVDGQDVDGVRKAFVEPIARARRGEGPSFLEIGTYRFRGHSMSDPGKYRTPEEVEERKKRDPIRIVRDRLIESGTSEAALSEVEAKVDAEIADAVAFAEASPPAREDVALSLALAPSGEP